MNAPLSTPHAPSPAALPAHASGRRASWFELFFDLVFVVAVAQLAGALAHHYDWQGALLFAFAFLALWWCWLGHTFYSTRFDEDTPRQRNLGLLHILTVAWLAYGAGDIADERAWVFASGMVAFKLLLAAAYLRAWRWSGARGLIRAYAALYGLQALLWFCSLAFHAEARWAWWGAALLLDLASPWWVARYTHQIPPHPEHLPERFGLFTIILLGEGMASVVHALDHGPALTGDAIVAAVGGALLTFLVWLGYFDRVGAQQERHVADPRAGTQLRLWAYSHVALYLGLAALAAGTVFLASLHQLTLLAQQIFSVAVLLCMVGLSLLGLAGRADHRASSLRRSMGHLGLAAAYGVFMASVEMSQTALLMALSAGVMALQLWWARAGGGRHAG